MLLHRKLNNSKASNMAQVLLVALTLLLITIIGNTPTKAQAAASVVSPAYDVSSGGLTLGFSIANGATATIGTKIDTFVILTNHSNVSLTVNRQYPVYIRPISPLYLTCVAATYGPGQFTPETITGYPSYVTAFDEANTTLAPGQQLWFSVEIPVPANLYPGTYTLAAGINSPDEAGNFHYLVQNTQAQFSY